MGATVGECRHQIRSQQRTADRPHVERFQVAERLRGEDPAAFQRLASVPSPHRRFLVDGTYDVALAADWRAIELADNGDIVGVRVDERTMVPLAVPGDELIALYRPLQEFLRRLYGVSAAIEFLLPGGDAVVFDNHRVLRARTGFTQRRHIHQCHVDRDEFHSRLRALRHRLGGRELVSPRQVRRCEYSLAGNNEKCDCHR